MASCVRLTQTPIQTVYGSMELGSGSVEKTMEGQLCKHTHTSRLTLHGPAVNNMTYYHLHHVSLGVNMVIMVFEHFLI